MAVRAEKAPYALTVLFVVWAWVFTHYVEGVRQDQIVVYTIDLQAHKDKKGPLKQAIVSLENITRDKTFRSFVVHVRKRTIEDDIQFVLPTSAEHFASMYSIDLGGGIRATGNERIEVVPDGVEYVIPDLTPGATVTLRSVYRGNEVPVVVGSANGGSVLKLAKAGFSTRVARLEYWIIFAGAAVMSLLLLRALASAPQQSS